MTIYSTKNDGIIRKYKQSSIKEKGK